MFWVKKKEFEKLQNEVTHLSSEFDMLKRIMLYAKDGPTCRFAYEYDDREGWCNVVYIYPGRNRFEEFRFVLKEIDGILLPKDHTFCFSDGIATLIVTSRSIFCENKRYKFNIDCAHNKYICMGVMNLEETEDE